MTPERFVRDPAALWRRTLDSVVILGPRMEGPLVVGGTGPLLWEVLAHPVSVEEIVEAFAEEFGVPTSTVANDLAPLLEQLRAGGAVGPADSV